jgi:phosphoglycolate phosphatase-like HAD superfamily hydrolase
MVGDQTADIEMAARAGLRSVLVKTGSAGRDGKYSCSPDFVVDDVAAAADLIRREKVRAA